jgi:hypothetical protein
MRCALIALLASATVAGVAVAAAPRPPQGAPATCQHQSSAGFRKSARDLAIGPLLMVGARQYSSPAVIGRFGGQKYAMVVLAGHRVTVELPSAVRRTTSLLYADDHWKQPGGDRTVGDGHRVVTFRACTAARAGSSYDGRDATFWSGFVLTTVPRCLTVRIWIDDEPTPRRVGIALGKRCA